MQTRLQYAAAPQQLRRSLPAPRVHWRALHPEPRPPRSVRPLTVQDRGEPPHLPPSDADWREVGGNFNSGETSSTSCTRPLSKAVRPGAEGTRDGTDLTNCVARLRILEAHLGHVQVGVIKCLLRAGGGEAWCPALMVVTPQDHLTAERRLPMPDFVPTVGELHCLAKEYISEWYRDGEYWIMYRTVGSDDWKDMKRCEARRDLLEAILGTSEFTAVVAPVHEYYLARVREIGEEVRQEEEAARHGTGAGTTEMALSGSGGEDDDDDYPI